MAQEAKAVTWALSASGETLAEQWGGVPMCARDSVGIGLMRICITLDCTDTSDAVQWSLSGEAIFIPFILEEVRERARELSIETCLNQIYPSR